MKKNIIGLLLVILEARAIPVAVVMIAKNITLVVLFMAQAPYVVVKLLVVAREEQHPLIASIIILAIAT